MPFYLVTYTGLVEAEDEVGAAEKIMEKLQSEPRMTFTVKLDENSVKHVSVARRAEPADEASPAQPLMYSEGETPASPLIQETEAMVVDIAKRKASAGVIGAVFLAVSFAACGIAGLLHL